MEDSPDDAQNDRSSDPLEQPGTRLGRYLLAEVIGEGAFGLVYRAEQQEPVRREVALKIVKAGMDTREVIARFEAERQALALMEHPGIAHVLDAGATDNGRPYFVMELVRGAPITEWCDAHSLDVPARLALFRRVCEAVQHAHQKGVVHRDIKPSNVLVAEDKGDPAPKVIDFGVAKAMQGPLGDSSLVTTAGQVIGTPAYMSPEQAAGHGDDADTRSDVYSLGVLLYELLTGTLPFEPARLRKLGYARAQKVLMEEEPPRPSTRLSTLGERASTAAKTRGVPPTTLVRRLRGDLDWIVMKALEKDPERRYGSAHDLALDLQRHQDHEPVSAGPPGAAYQLRKLVRRHRGLVGAAAVVLLALVLGAVGLTMGLLEARAANAELGETLGQLETAHDELTIAHDTLGESNRKLEVRTQELAWERDRAREAEQLAEQEAAVVRETHEFLNKDLLGAVDPDLMGHDVTVREVLDLASASASTRFAGRPRLEVQLRGTLADSYSRLGLADRALAEVDRQEELWEQLGGGEADGEGTLTARARRASLLDDKGHFQESEAVYRDVIAEATETLGIDHPITLGLRSGLAVCLVNQSRLDEAEVLHREVLQQHRMVFGPLHEETLITAGNLGLLLKEKGRFEEALPLMREAAGTAALLYGEDDSHVLNARGNLSALLMELGQTREAEQLALENIVLSRRVHGDDYAGTALKLNDLGLVRETQGRVQEAAELFEEAYAILRRGLGEEHQHTLVIAGNLAGAYDSIGESERSLELRQRVLATQRRVLGDVHHDTLSTLNNMGALLWGMGRLDEAEVYYQEALDGQRQELGDDHATTLVTLENLGGLYFTRGDKVRASELTQQVLAGRRRVLGDDHPDVAKTLLNLGIVQAGMGRNDEARVLMQLAEQRLLAHYGPIHDRRALALQHLGDMALDEERDKDAEAALRECMRINDQLTPAGFPIHGYLRHQLAAALRRLGRIEEALPLIEEAVALRRMQDDPGKLAVTLYLYSSVLLDLARHEAAAESARESAETFLEAYGPDDTRTGRAVRHVIEIFDSWERATPGVGHAEQAAAWRVRLSQP